ncbi:MAG: MarR family transcriptional regulator [Polyangiaceae bacterium]|nr:MarR family transcriptional regulator [Polyangiaceae bacterium]
MTADRTDDLRRLTHRLVRRFGALSSDSTPCGKPVSMAYAHALMVLLYRGELSQQELGEELCIDKSNVARLCAKLVAAEHATQRPCELDGRSRRVLLTRSGTRLAKDIDASSRARFAALLGAVPANRRRDVVGALQLLVDALDMSTTVSDATGSSE